MKILKRVHLMVSPEQWNTFSSKCRKNGDTMTKVFYHAIDDYMEYGKDGSKNSRACLKFWLEGANNGTFKVEQSLIDFTLSCLEREYIKKGGKDNG